MNDLFFNFLGWDKDFYNFSRSTKDLYPYEIVKQEDGCTIVFNALGISKENVKIDFDKSRGTDYLLISGENKNKVTNKNYSINARFIVDTNEIKDINWYVQDGLLYIEITYKRPEKPQIKINYKE